MPILYTGQEIPMFTFVFAAVFVYVIALFLSFAGNRLVARKCPTKPMELVVEAIAPEVVKPKPQSLGSAAVSYGSMTVRELREICKGNPKYKGYSKHCKSQRELAAFVNMTDMIGRGFDPIVAFECRYDF
jgi:hypothetical protein